MKILWLIVLIWLTNLQAYAQSPCANVYIYNATIGVAGHSTPADMFARNSIEEQVKKWKGLCFKAYVPSFEEWQAQGHHKNDVLLFYTVGTLDDSNGVGEVGKTIEVVTFEVYSWDSKLNRINGGGPNLAWFAISRDTLRLQMWADSAAANIVYVVDLMSQEGRQAK
jgi:hypothetical protein